MAQRKRKRRHAGQARPTGRVGTAAAGDDRRGAAQRREPAAVTAYRARSEERNAAARATLTPLLPGERPWPILVGVGLTALASLSNLILYAVGAKVAGKHPAPGGIIIFSVLMLVCAVGMWRLWYQAVLAFMVLLAIVVLLFSLLMVEASNLLGVLVPPIFILGGGFLFWKLVRVLGRLQMPQRPGR